MRTTLAKAWDALRTSFWFVPALIGAAAAALAFAAVALDQGQAGRWVAAHDLGYGGGADGASTLLQTIASSMMTIAGVVFSLTLVCLSLASSQFGPRLLRNFIGDRPNQVVLGVFLATFLYCVLVLRTVRRADESLFVPHIAVALALLLAAASLAMLVYYIHHLARTIQADDVVARVGEELVRGIERMFPAPADGERDATVPKGPVPGVPARDAEVIEAPAEGYVQLVDQNGLVEQAAASRIGLEVALRPGDYVMRGTPLATAWPRSRAASPGVRRAIAACFAVGPMRTPMQDVRFPLQQLVEIAVRALSPSINDPFTAIACVDRIAGALRILAGRAALPFDHADPGGSCRVILACVTFEELVGAAFDPIRRHARGNVQVLERQFAAIVQIATATCRATDMETLHSQVEALWRAAEPVPEPRDREALQSAYLAALAAVGPGARRRDGRADSRTNSL